MILSTTPTLEGKTIREYRGIVVGEAILGANLFKDSLCRDPRHHRRPLRRL